MIHRKLIERISQITSEQGTELLGCKREAAVGKVPRYLGEQNVLHYTAAPSWLNDFLVSCDPTLRVYNTWIAVQSSASEPFMNMRKLDKVGERFLIPLSSGILFQAAGFSKRYALNKTTRFQEMLIRNAVYRVNTRCYQAYANKDLPFTCLVALMIDKNNKDTDLLDIVGPTTLQEWCSAA
jgi:hypothetical protein